MPKISSIWAVSLLVFVITSFICPQNSFASLQCIVNSKLGHQLNLPIDEWVDINVPHKGIIVAVHGLTLYAKCWDNLAKHLASKGYDVYALDMRGFGRWRAEGSKFGGNNKIEISQSQQDLLDLITTLRQAHPNQKLFCLGESMGSNMILLLLAEHHELADGAILGSLCYKTRIHPSLHWAEDFAKEIVKPNAPLNLEPYAAPYLTNNPALAKACDTDPMINRRMTPAELVKVDLLDDKAISDAKNLPADFPILMISGTQDAMFKSTDLPKVIKKFGSQNVTLNLLSGKAHLLLEHQVVDPQITTMIDAWLAHQITTPKK